jgi:predicted DsbA family dithiol-disulfide isomerase
VRLAHQFALENDLITADMVEATEFPHLSHRYQVRGVPRTVVNETGFIDGGLPEAMFVEQMLAEAQGDGEEREAHRAAPVALGAQ